MPKDCDGVAEWDHRHPSDRHNEDHQWREIKDHLVGMGRNEVFLAEQLDAVGNGLQEPFRPRAVRTYAVLHSGEHLALVPRHIRHADEKDVHEDERHHKRQPEWLIHTSAMLLPNNPISHQSRPRKCAGTFGNSATHWVPAYTAVKALSVFDPRRSRRIRKQGR